MLRRKKNRLILIGLTALAYLVAGQFAEYATADEDGERIVLSKPTILSVWPAHEDMPTEWDTACEKPTDEECTDEENEDGEDTDDGDTDDGDTDDGDADDGDADDGDADDGDTDDGDADDGDADDGDADDGDADDGDADDGDADDGDADDGDADDGDADDGDADDGDADDGDADDGDADDGDADDGDADADDEDGTEDAGNEHADHEGENVDESSPATSTKYCLDKAPLKVLVGNVKIGDILTVKSPPNLGVAPVTCLSKNPIIKLPTLPRGDHVLVIVSSRANLMLESEEIRLQIDFPPAPRIDAISAQGVAPRPIIRHEVSISADDIDVSVAGVLKGDEVRVYLDEKLQKQDPRIEAGKDGQPVTITVEPPTENKEYQVTATIVRGGDESPHSAPVKLKYKIPASQLHPVAITKVPDYAFAHQPIVEPLIPADDARRIAESASADKAPVDSARVYDKGFHRLELADSDEKVVQYRFLEAARFPRAAFRPGGVRYDDQGLTIFEGMQLVFHESGRYEVRFATSEPTMPVDLQLQFSLKSGNGKHTLFTLPKIHVAPTENEEGTRSVPQQVRHVGYSPVVETCFDQIKEVVQTTCCGTKPSIASSSLSRSGSARFGYGSDFQ